jgi:hypothetical protein
LEDNALLQVRKGILQAISNIANSSFMEWFMSLHTAVRENLVHVDYEGVWQSSAGLIDVQFLREMASMFQDVAQSRVGCLPKPSCISDQFPSAVFQHPTLVAGVSDEVWKVLPDVIKDELTRVQEKPFKILVMQLAATSAGACALAIDRALRADKDRTGEVAGLVLLPEDVIEEKLVSDITPLLANKTGSAPPGGGPAPSELKEIAHVAKEHGIYIVCGSMDEPCMTRLQTNGSHMNYITSVVVGPDGNAVGAYRKRKIHDHQAQLMGDRPFVFNVPGLGMSAVLICYDAEDRELRDEVIDLGAQCVLNPIHIPDRGCGVQDAQALQRVWQTSCDQMAEDLTYICHKRGITWVRCDRPYPGGMGSSQVIGPEITYRFCSMYDEVLPVCLLPSACSAGHIPFLVKKPPNSKERSKPEQNCGPRCTISSVVVDGIVDSVQFYRSHEQPQSAKTPKIKFVLSDQSVGTMEVFPSLYIRKLGKPGTSEHDNIMTEVRTVCVTDEVAPAMSEHKHSRWLGDGGRFLLSLSDAGKLTLHLMGADCNLRRPLVIPTNDCFRCLAVDQSDIFATVSLSHDHKSKVSVWSFTHNCMPFPLSDFLDL